MIGHQTLTCIEKFPLEYKIEINNNQKNNQVGIKCHIENGEVTILASKDTKIEMNPNIENVFDIELFSIN